MFNDYEFDYEVEKFEEGEVYYLPKHVEEYDIDIRALLAGADSKKVKPKYWIKNIDEKEL